METIIKKNNKTLTIELDDCSSSPREWDNLTEMICFHNRYDLGDDHNFDADDYSSFDEIKEAIIKEKDIAIILPLFLYDHSGITISTGSFNCRFDSGQIGFIIVTKEAIRENFLTKRISKKQIEKAEEILKAELKTYDDYIRGEVYWFKVTKNVFNKELNEMEEEEINSCGGFFGDDFKENGLLEYIEDEELTKALIENL